MENTTTQPKRASQKRNIILMLLILILGFAGYGYYWFTGVLSRDQEAKIVLMEAKKYQENKEIIVQEYDRCQEFISQREGDFGSFEYCKKFIQWVNDWRLLTE